MPSSSRIGTLVALAVSCSLTASAQDRGRGWDRESFTRLDPGTTISVRTSETIDVTRADYRVHYATVDRDVRGENGRMAIPRGSVVELMVRTAPDNDLVLDLESVAVDGRRYAISTDQTRIASGAPGGLVASIFGAIPGVDIRGRAVRVPRGSLLSFRLERPLDMDVADVGVTRDQYHYHDWYGQNGSGDGFSNRNGNDRSSGRSGTPRQQGNYGGAPVSGSSTDRTVTVPANQQWTDTGVDVRRGDVMHFRASGNVTLSQNANDNATPAGANSGRMAGNSPLRGVIAGMLIGRVNNDQPFAIGVQTDVTIPTNGRLYLGINDDYVGDNSGNFVVQLSSR
jgi:hypothetical protein